MQRLNVYNKNGRIGIYTPAERAAIIQKFNAKRARRVWNEKIRYNCRKDLADRRMRVKGRFVKRSVEASSSSSCPPPTTGSPLCTVDEREEEQDDGQQPMDEDMPDVKDLETGFEPSDDMPYVRINHCPGKSIQPNGEADTRLQAIPANNDKRFDNAGHWTKEEHEAFLSGLKMHGKDWTKVAAHVSIRTNTQTRTHAQKYFQKLSKDEVR